MRRTLYEVLQDTRLAAASLRTGAIDASISEKLARFEAAIDHALESSPDAATVARAEEFVALNALCDLHVALQGGPAELRDRLRPIVDDWIAYAASTGLTPHELARSAAQDLTVEVESWLRTVE